jgi:RNA polymerase sigma-70 factor (ECF subfamily)
VSDGNGAIRVARTPVVGPERVAKFFTAISGWYWDGVEISWASANGGTAAVMRKNGEFIGVITVTGSESRIDRVLWMVVPEKLAQLS